jgi:hypothetical protein
MSIVKKKKKPVNKTKNNFKEFLMSSHNTVSIEEARRQVEEKYPRYAK